MIKTSSGVPIPNMRSPRTIPPATRGLAQDPPSSDPRGSPAQRSETILS
jgi:hypothetical protein